MSTKIITPILLIGFSSMALAVEKSAPKNHVICKAGIAAIMGRSPSIMKASNIDGPVIGISYIRKDDGTKWALKCRILGNKIIWGNSDGRWRTDPLDGVVNYKIEKDSIVVAVRYYDGSESLEKYKISALGK